MIKEKPAPTGSTYPTNEDLIPAISSGDQGADERLHVSFPGGPSGSGSLPSLEIDNSPALEPTQTEEQDTSEPGADQNESGDRSLGGFLRRNKAIGLAAAGLALGTGAIGAATSPDQAKAANTQVFIGDVGDDGKQHVIAWDDARSAGYQVISNRRPSNEVLPNETDWVPRLSGLWDYGKVEGQPVPSQYEQGILMADIVAKSVTVGLDGRPNAGEVAIDELKGKTKVKILSFVEAMRTKYPHLANKVTIYVANGPSVNFNNYRVATKHWPGKTTKDERKKGISVVHRALKAGINIGEEYYIDFDKHYFNPKFKGNTRAMDMSIAHYIDGRARSTKVDGKLIRFPARTRGDWLRKHRDRLGSSSAIYTTVATINRFNNSKISYQAMDRVLYNLYNKTTHRRHFKAGKDRIIGWKLSEHKNHVDSRAEASVRDKQFVNLVNRYAVRGVRTPRWREVQPTPAQTRRIMISRRSGR